MITPERLGWMAGIIDLKGRIYTKRNRQRATAQMVLTVDSKEIGVIRALGSMTGTSPELQTATDMPEFMRRNCGQHCPDAHTHVQAVQYLPAIGRWTITGASMVVVLSSLMPMLTVDRGYEEAVDVAIKNTKLTGQGSGMVVMGLLRLKDLGWPLPEVYEDAFADDENEEAQP